MRFFRTALPDVIAIEPDVFQDERGWFMETFQQARFTEALQKLGLSVPTQWLQDNHSCSKKNVLRGLHYQQTPHAQGKLIRVISGAIFDVAVDVRHESATFGRWIGMTLSADNRRMLWIPEGFAHGFLALAHETHVLYKTTRAYDPPSERSLAWNDPDIGIEWPLESGQTPVLSDKDAAAPRLREFNSASRLA